MQLTITDLFVVDLGVELVGAWLVARGLLLSPSMLKSFGTHAGIGVADVVDRARNRIDARFGISFLMAGFAVQLLGYLLEIDNHRPEQGPDLLLGALALLLGSMLSCLPRLVVFPQAPLQALSGDDRDVPATHGGRRDRPGPPGERQMARVVWQGSGLAGPDV